MNNSQAVAARPRAVSAGTLLLVSCGLALYQITSLVLAPQTVRQINLSMSVPEVNAEELGAPLGGDITLVLGEVTAIIGPKAPMPAARLVQTAPILVVRHTATPVAAPNVSPVPAPGSIVLPVPTPASPEHATRDKGRGRHLGWMLTQD